VALTLAHLFTQLIRALNLSLIPSLTRPCAQFYGAVQTDGGDLLREPMLVVEFCEGGDLRRALSLDVQTVSCRPLAPPRAQAPHACS